MISFATAIDPLRIANKLLGQDYFDYSCVSLDGKAVTSSCAIDIQVKDKLENLKNPDLLIVASSDGVEGQTSIDMIGNHLRKLETHGTRLGGICTGSYLLAKCNLLRGRSCAIHWEYLEVAQETFPLANFQPHVYVHDGGLITAAGGTTPIDLMTTVITNEVGEKLANKVREIAIHHDKRDGSEHQRLKVQSRFTVYNPRLVKCLELMEEHIEIPLQTQAICEELGLSMRQTQRMFKRYIGQSPTKYYTDLRLERARSLIQRSTMSICEVTIATGFSSSSHFSNLYRKKFGATPSNHRIEMIAAVKAKFS